MHIGNCLKVAETNFKADQCPPLVLKDMAKKWIFPTAPSILYAERVQGRNDELLYATLKIEHPKQLHVSVCS